MIRLRISSTAQSRGLLCSGRRPRRPNGLRDAGRYKAAATLRCTVREPHAEAQRAQRGIHRAFTLVEAVISAVVVGVMLVAALNTVGASRIGQQKTGDRTKGALLAQQLMTEILQQYYADPENGGFGLDGDEVGDGSRSLWDDVDDYDGWSASPPQRKDGTVIAEFDGWERSVSVAWVNPYNLQAAVGTDLGVKRITVTVTRDDVPIATQVAVRTSGWDEATEWPAATGPARNRKS